MSTGRNIIQKVGENKPKPDEKNSQHELRTALDKSIFEYFHMQWGFSSHKGCAYVYNYYLPGVNHQRILMMQKSL